MASTKKATKRTTKKATAKKPTTKKATSKKAAATPPAAPKTPPKSAKVAPSKPTTIDEYLSHVEPATRELLQRLRQTIHELVPEVSECISYSMPAFRYKGKVIAGFLATKTGASYFPFSGTTLATLSTVLEGRSQTKSGLHFTREDPLPKALVNTLLQARIAEL